MTHFPALVLVDEPITREQAEEAVTPLLSPYDENDEWFRDDSRWDWWVIGGRWTGAISPEPYDPTEDPQNFETCKLCSGTGLRPDWARFEKESPGWREWSKGCNGCSGKGWHVAWRYREHAGDVVPVRRITPRLYDREDGSQEKFLPLVVVTPDGKWHEQARYGWFGSVIEDEEGQGEKPDDLWAATVQALLKQHPKATAVLVDCHV